MNNTRIPFGKYYNKTLKDVLFQDVSYLKWLSKVAYGKLYKVLKQNEDVIKKRMYKIYRRHN